MASEIMSVRVSAELKAALSDAAARDFRTPSGLVTKILNEWLRDHGVAGNPDVAPAIHSLPRGRPRTSSTDDGVHPWRGMIDEWLGERDRTTTDEVLEGAMKIDPVAAQVGQRKAVELVLSELGWRKLTERKAGAEDQVIWQRL
jgi:hypothetical protein